MWDSSSSSSSFGLHPLFLSGRDASPSKRILLPFPSSFSFSPFSSPRAGCGALNTHLAPFVFFFSSLLLLLLSPLRFFLLSPGGLRRPKYASRPFSSFLSFSLSPSLFFSPFHYYFRLFLFARLGMACSWCRSSTLRCSFSTRFRRVSGLFGVLCPRR